jgi:hypothetical protein
MDVDRYTAFASKLAPTVIQVHFKPAARLPPFVTTVTES